MEHTKPPHFKKSKNSTRVYGGRIRGKHPPLLDLHVTGSSASVSSRGGKRAQVRASRAHVFGATLLDTSRVEGVHASTLNTSSRAIVRAFVGSFANRGCHAVPVVCCLADNPTQASSQSAFDFKGNIITPSPDIRRREACCNSTDSVWACAVHVSGI